MADYDLISSLLLEQKDIAADNPYLNFASSMPQMQASQNPRQNAIAQSLASFTQNFAKTYGKKQVKQEQEDLAKGVAAALTSENPQEKLKEVSPTLASAYELQVAQAKQKQQELAQKMGMDLQKYQMQQDYSHGLQRERMAEQAGYSAQLKAIPTARAEQNWDNPAAAPIVTKLALNKPLTPEEATVMESLSKGDMRLATSALSLGNVQGRSENAATRKDKEATQDIFKTADDLFDKNPITKDATKALIGAEKAKTLLAQDNSISHGAMMSVFAKSIGSDSGVLSNRDIERIQDPTLRSDIMQLANYATGNPGAKITDQQKKAYKAALDAVQISSNNAINSARSEVYNRVRNRFANRLDPETSAELESHVFETLGSATSRPTYNPTGDQGGVTPAATQPGIAEITQFRQANPNATPEEIRAKAIELGIPLR